MSYKSKTQQREEDAIKHLSQDNADNGDRTSDNVRDERGPQQEKLFPHLCTLDATVAEIHSKDTIILADARKKEVPARNSNEASEAAGSAVGNMNSAYRAWTHVACYAFVAATVYALAVVALRMPGIAAAPDAFRFALALHVELAVFVWLASSMAGQWIQGISTPRSAAAPFLALIGTTLIVLAPLGGGSPVMADYFPWIDGNRLFGMGFALFCLSVLLAAAHAVWHSGTDLSRRLSAWCFIAAGITLIGDLSNGARDPHALAWGVGHVLLFAHVAMMLWEWRTLTGTGHHTARFGSLWLALVSGLLAMVPWIYSPTSPEHRVLYTEAMRWLLWPPAAALLAAIVLVSIRRRTRPPTGILISMALLSAGLVLGTLIDGQTTLITAHYHAAIGAVAISRMAMTYQLYAPEFPRVSAQKRTRQLITYSAGLALLIAGLLTASLDNAPRKTSGMESVDRGKAYSIGMAISGLGGLLAMTGSIWLVANLWRCRDGWPRQVCQGREEKRTAKCQPIAATPKTAVANSQGIVQS